MHSKMLSKSIAALIYSAILSMATLLCPTVGLADTAHTADDAFWEAAASLLPPFNGTPAAPGASSDNGAWGPILPWPHVPVSAASLPNGKILTYSGQELRTWPGTKTQTHTATWNPTTGAFDNELFLDHEMFCAHLVVRTDGNVQTIGGRYTVVDSSTYDFRDNAWNRVQDMNDPRWYTSAVALPNGDVFTASGNGGVNTVERYNELTGWQLLSGINWQPISGYNAFESRWWAYLFVAPDGNIFHAGPTRDMHWVDPYGNGNLITTALTVPGPTNYYPKHAGVVMYESGKIIIAGGAADPNNSQTSTNACYTVDLNTTPPTVTQIASMTHARRFSNAVVLPSGEVLIIGGNTSGKKFSDEGAILTPEIWNPTTGAWREVNDMAVPRNYHSVALLMQDGTVFSEAVVTSPTTKLRQRPTRT